MHTQNAVFWTAQPTSRSGRSGAPNGRSARACEVQGRSHSVRTMHLVRVSRFPVRLRPIPAGKVGLSSNAPARALRQDSMVTGEEMAGNRGGTMNQILRYVFTARPVDRHERAITRISRVKR